MALPESAVAAPLDVGMSAAEMYQEGYRAIRTGGNIGEVRDPLGKTYRINRRLSSCTCRLRTGGRVQSPCIHLKMFMGLRCEELARDAPAIPHNTNFGCEDTDEECEIEGGHIEAIEIDT